MNQSASQGENSGRAVRWRFWAPVVVLIAATALVAWSRVGALNLPDVPHGLTAADAGLTGLEAMNELDHYVRGGLPNPGQPEADATGASASTAPPSEAARLVRQGLLLVRLGEVEAGLAKMRSGVEQAPDDLVLANAYRMELFQLKRSFGDASRLGGGLTAEFPSELEGQPIDFFEHLAAEHPTRETRLHLAMAWIDTMLLFPALEMKAPASVEAVGILTGILEGGNPDYVPALFARGLNHLHRPSRLVWPQTHDVPKDAAVQDISRCVAIGRKLDVGSSRLRAVLATALGDAYVKAGALNSARSWWQIARNLSRDESTLQSVRRRFQWPDERVLDALEAELDRARAELDRPMTDLAFMWEGS